MNNGIIYWSLRRVVMDPGALVINVPVIINKSSSLSMGDATVKIEETIKKKLNQTLKMELGPIISRQLNFNTVGPSTIEIIFEITNI